MPRPTTTPDPTPDSFGATLARLRKQRGLTQVELSEKVGLVQPVVSDYERGRLRPYADVAARFALALCVSCDELLGVGTKRSGREHAPSPRVLKRLKAIERLPRRDRDALLRTIDGFLAKAS